MVNGQIDPVPIDLGVFRQQGQRGDVHADHMVGSEVLRGPELLGIGQEVLRGLPVVEEIGRPAQLPQSDAQCGGAADGVAVGAAVGQDQNVVIGAQQCGGLLCGHWGSSSPSERCSSRRSMSRSISRMWAPC